MDHDYDFYRASAEYVRARSPETPEIGMVLGTGLGRFAERIEDPVVIDYRDIPNFLTTTVSDHAGKLILGTVAGRRVACMSGRFHYYEGYDFEQLSIPVRLFKLLGAKQLLLTNAAGAVNTSYRPGDIMVVSDHIKLMGASPMRGRNLDEFGERFFDVSDMYSRALRAVALRCAEGSGLSVHEGVYFYMPGPQFETPAEIRAIRALGGDAVGMSTVTEALTAAHCGLPVLCLSVMTNMAAGVLDAPVTAEEVGETGSRIEGPFADYVTRILAELP